MSAQELRRQRGYIKAKITKVRKYVENVVNKKVSANLETVVVYMDKLEKAYQEFNEIQRKLVCAIIEDELPAEDQQEDDTFEDRYVELKATLTKWSSALKPAASTSSGSESLAHVLEQQTEVIRTLSASNAGSHIDKRVKLPTIKLPTFSGEIEDWKRFSDTFTTLIDNSELAAVQKYQYLIGAVTGGAARVIESIEISAQNYELAWSLLKNRYEDPKALKRRHIQRLFEAPKVERESAGAIQELINHFQKHLRIVKSMESESESWADSLVLYMIEERLDKCTRRRWEESMESRRSISTDLLFEFLQRRVQMLDRLGSSLSKGEPSVKGAGPRFGRVNPAENLRLSGGGDSRAPRSKQGNSAVSLATSTIAGRCFVCNGPHLIYSCERFLNLSAQERIEEVKRLKLCFNCLRNDHLASACRASSCRRCAKRHNTLCHKDNERSHIEKPVVVSSETVNKEIEQSNNTNVNLSVQRAAKRSELGPILMSTAVIYIEDSRGFNQPIRVLLDSGSEANFMTKAACVKLNIKTSNVHEAVSGMGSVVSAITQGCRVTIKSRVTSYQVSVFCLIVPTITRELPSIAINNRSFAATDTLRLADPQYFHPSQIDMLIGSEFFMKLLEPERVDLGINLPTLQNTKLGWVISGPVPAQYIKREINKHVICMATQSSLHESLAKFWEIEDCSDHGAVSLSHEERACEDIFRENHTRNEEGRFVVRLPFRRNKQELGESRLSAERRLLYLERKFRSNESFRRLYTDFMREYIELNHMTIIPTISETDARAVYLPHHGVVRDAAVSTRLRVVFDASAKTSSGISLNDTLMIGATLQDPLINIVLRFRIHPIVVTADLQKMYRQILVHESDRDCQRILWRFSSDEPIREYHLNTVTYGQSCAPFLAIRSVRQLASDAERHYPRASRTLLRDLYVDDILTGVNNVNEARLLVGELKQLLESGKFEPHKWRSNCAEVFVGKCDFNDTSDVQAITDERDIVKTLGLQWQPSSDELRFESRARLDASTKRSILSSISTLFDPLGLASPLVIKAKIIMQSTWRLNIGWDEELPADLRRAWSEYVQDLARIDEVRIPRRVIGCLHPLSINVHAFCDASERAYGACVYIQAIAGANQRVSRLLCAKSRVAPVKRVTIPRLELCGAVMLVDLIQVVLKSLTIDVAGVYAWSDSSVVLAWIAGDPGRQKTFVSNRITKIQSILPGDHWGHVAGKENPADIVSRGTNVDSLKASSLWWFGPPWLSEFAGQSQHRTRKLSERELEIVQSEETIEKRVFIARATSDSIVESMLCELSSLTRIERILAWCWRFVANSRKKPIEREFGGLSVKELLSSRLRLIRYVQEQFFGRELHSLIDRGHLDNSNPLKAMSPFIDDNGVLRVGGRLQRSKANYDKKHPILLPARGRFIKLLFVREHRRLLHAGPQALLASIRERYWPLNGRNAARKIVRECVVCFRSNPRTMSQVMGPLPPERVICQRAFSVVGVDYAGPITTLINRGRGQKTRKSYIALFVCFSTKAVHLEAVSDLTSDAFLAALRRFIGRRGHPTAIYSDNATNFVGAKRELDDLYNAIRTTFSGPIDDYCVSRQIHWKFIPPHAPHMGGLWEAGIKSCKYHLKRVVGETRLVFEELATVLAQVEACLNSRPLCQLSSDPNDLQALTPAHFLIGEPLTGLPDIDLVDVSVNRLDRWQLTQRMAQHFWKRWSVEYLTSLQGKCKWKKEQRNLNVNDMVLVVTENAPPLQWKIGRVIELHPGIDNKVRVATIKTKGTVIKRSITKLCKLPIDSDNN